MHTKQHTLELHLAVGIITSFHLVDEMCWCWWTEEYETRWPVRVWTVLRLFIVNNIHFSGKHLVLDTVALAVGLLFLCCLPVFNKI